jgi:alkylmercury lyase
MSTEYIERSTAIINGIEGLELVPHAMRLLAEGEPVALEELAAAARHSLEEVRAALGVQTSAELDSDGRLVGLGLTLRPTPHRYLLDGRTVFAWCASDALTFPVVLGRPGVIESTCGSTGQPIRIELTRDGVDRVDPSGAVVSAVRPTGQLADVRSAICQQGRFFASPRAAEHWAAEHPEGEIRSVEEAFAVDRAVVTQVGWAASERNSEDD